MVISVSSPSFLHAGGGKVLPVDIFAVRICTAKIFIAFGVIKIIGAGGY